MNKFRKIKNAMTLIFTNLLILALLPTMASAQEMISLAEMKGNLAKLENELSYYRYVIRENDVMCYEIYKGDYQDREILGSVAKNY
ncbi:MAG: hypothetical protein HUN05_14260 [Desulfobacter sp.]|nr:MAG: hypothetical protein HUN05_14260 [Desulfobacter sp.]